MKKALKELIAKAKPYDESIKDFEAFYLVDSGKKYNGFWGKSKYYNQYIVIGIVVKPNNEIEYYNLNSDYQSDIVKLVNSSTNPLHSVEFDIDNELGCIRMYSDFGFRIDGTILSKITIVAK